MDDLISTLLEIPFELVGGGILLLLILFTLLRLRARKRRAARRLERRAKRADATVIAAATEGGASKPDDLPRITAYPMPVIGLIEERVFDELEDLASQSIMGHRVLTQLSLSAFLYAGSSGYSRADEQRVAAYLSSLQVDFLIVDADWQPVVAVNIERDAIAGTDATEVEREICIRAGVAYIVVTADGLSKERRAEIGHLLKAKTGIAAQ